MKPQCRSCDFLEINPHSDEWFCMHDDANEAQIIFYYIQQRRPVWCPLIKKEKKSMNTCVECYCYSDITVKKYDRENEPTTEDSNACSLFDPKEET